MRMISRGSAFCVDPSFAARNLQLGVRSTRYTKAQWQCSRHWLGLSKQVRGHVRGARYGAENEKSLADLNSKGLVSTCETEKARETVPYIFKWSLLTSANAVSGALLGPLLDNYHSVFGALVYHNPLVFTLFNTLSVTTQLWVPPLFALAGVIIGNGVVILDQYLKPSRAQAPNPPTSLVLLSIACFTFTYYLSGLLSTSSHSISNPAMFAILSILAFIQFLTLDATKSVAIMTLATALCGPLIELFLIDQLHLYHYSNPTDGVSIPLWIIPVYAAGPTAVGLLSRKYSALIFFSNCDPS